jgi:rhodanese-related sulfurtransferase
MIFLDPEYFVTEVALSDDAYLIDVRPDFQLVNDPSIEGAVHLDFLELDFDHSIKSLDPYGQFYLYCQNGILSTRAGKYLNSKGIGSVYILEGGKNAWNLIFKTLKI